MANGYDGPVIFEFDGSSTQALARLTTDATGWGGVLMVGEDEDDLFHDAFGQRPSTVLLSGDVAAVVRVDRITPGVAYVTGLSPVPF